ncbi:unnamed protein product, partial [Mesorhabditis spiculigera]
MVNDEEANRVRDQCSVVWILQKRFQALPATCCYSDFATSMAGMLEKKVPRAGQAMMHDIVLGSRNTQETRAPRQRGAASRRPARKKTTDSTYLQSFVDTLKGYWERIEDKVENKLKNCHPNKRNHFMDLQAEVKETLEVDFWPRWELETTRGSQADDEGSTEGEDEDEVRRQAKAKKKAEKEAGRKSRRDGEAGPSTKKQDKEKKKAGKQLELDEAVTKEKKKLTTFEREPSPDPSAVKRARRSPSATPMLEIVEASPEEMPDPPQKDAEEPQQAAQEEAPVETPKFGGWVPNIMALLAWEKASFCSFLTFLNVDPNKPPPKPYKRIDPKTLGLDPDLLLEDEEEDNKPYNCRTVVSIRHRDRLLSRRLWSTLPDLPIPEPGETLITKWDSCGIALGYEPSFIKRIARAELGPFVTVEYRDRQDVQLIPAEFLLMTRPDLHYQVKQRLKTLPATINTLATEIQWRLPGLELLKF